MTDFSTRAMLSVELDQRSVDDAKQTLEQELGSVRATVGQGSGAGAVPALTDGGDGVRGLLETQTEQLEEIREAVEDLRGGGRGGGGGVAAVGGGLASTAAMAGGIGLAGLGPIAALIGALSANAENGPRTDPGTPGVTQSSPSGRPDTGDTARDTGRMDSTPLIRPPDIPVPDWLSTLTNFTLSTPSWLPDLTSFAPSTPDWVRDLVGFDLETPGWVRDLTSVRFDEPGWLSRLTGFRLTAPSWLADLETLQLPTPQWVRDLQSIFATTSTTGGDNNDRPDSFPGSDQRLFNEATRRRDNGSGRTEVRNDITIEAVLNDLGGAQRIIEQAVEQKLRNEVLN